MIISESKSILLRHFRPKDREAIIELFTDPEVMRYGDGAQSAEWTTKWLESFVPEHHSSHGYGPLAVEEKNSGQCIGYCALQYFPDINGKPEVELGYRLLRSHWGKGYASEAAGLLRDYAFKNLGLTRLIALIDPENLASARVAEKLGMTREAEVMLEGYDHPDYVYVIEYAKGA